MHRAFPPVLQSIYGDNAIHLWHGSRVGSPEYTADGCGKSNEMDTIRYVVSLKYVSPFTSFSPVSFRVTVT